jgi:hypothetical protein
MFVGYIMPAKADPAPADAVPAAAGSHITANQWCCNQHACSGCSCSCCCWWSPHDAAQRVAPSMPAPAAPAHACLVCWYFCWFTWQTWVTWSSDPTEWLPLNHSCNPNTHLDGLNLVARRPIKQGEQVREGRSVSESVDLACLGMINNSLDDILSLL